LRILFVCSEPPDAPSAGSIIQTYHFLRLLSSDHEVGVWSYASDDPERMELVRARCAYTSFERPRSCHPIRNRLEWITGRDPMARWGYRGEDVLRSLDVAIGEFAPDFVQFEQLHVAWPLLKLVHRKRRPRLIFNAHDAVYVMLERAGASSPPKKAIQNLLSSWFCRQVKRVELEISHTADAVFCVSEIDARMLELPSRAKRYFVTPNGVDTEYFQPLTSKLPDAPPTLVFVGNLTYGPNSDAIQYYAEQIHPRLRERKPDLRLIVVGPVPPALERHRQTRGIVFAGFQRDIRPYFQEADISIVPLRSGSGTRFKILESWAMARPVISTTIGAEGLPYRDGENILVADSPDTFARRVLELLDGRGLASGLVQRGRRIVEEQFSWQRIVGDLRGHYGQIVGGAPGCDPAVTAPWPASRCTEGGDAIRQTGDQEPKMSL
jgi:glycosyltransferase involved in cell wall biosynthesis